MNLISAELTESQFKMISQLVYQLCGINLKDGKQALVRARLMKRLRALKLPDFETYLNYLGSAGGDHELNCLIDVITTNKTSFFREPEHFNYLRDKVLPELKKNRIRFWSAACSSGEESFSIGIVLRENIADIWSRDVKILATDISTRMLEKARKALYGEEELRDIPPMLLQKYFVRIQESPVRIYRVKENLRDMVRVARLNLMEPWPMKGPFDVIFCRNVMIYFDKPTQQTLINRFWDFLDSGGYLFVGHSEGLSAISHKFRYVRPAVYRK
jgi:chemotaxis protein methyltransferase CheR